MGVEREGGDAIAHKLLGRNVTDTSFIELETDPSWATEKRGGSANLDMIANAGALLWDNRNRGEWVRSWENFFEQEKSTFQRSEPWSIIYSGWHLIPVLSVYWWSKREPHQGLLQASKKWLENYWALASLASATLGNKPYLCLSGARSSGVPLDVWYSHRAAWCEALGVEWGTPESKDPNRAFSIDPTNAWCDISISRLSEEIRETSSKFVSWMRQGEWEKIIEAAPKFGMRGGGNLYRTRNGVCCWLERDVNGNTGGVLALKVQGNRVDSMPPNGGPHWRQKPTHATCERDGDFLRYESPHAELGKHTLYLPPGEVLFHIRIGETWEVIEPKPQAPDPTPQPPTQGQTPTPTKPKKRRNWFVRLLRKLFGKE